MSGEIDNSLLLKRIEERRAEEKARQQINEDARKTAGEFDDLVPDKEYERTEEDLNLDQAIERIDIIDAYIKWCGKMVPTVRGAQREGIKISCPIPGHADKNPSAWINLDKQTWYCAACDQGGDAYDLAAFAKGIEDYKSGANFHKLREEMAEDFGYTVTKLVGGTTVITPPEPEDSPEGETEEDLADVVSIDGSDEEEEDDFDLPGFDWQPFVPAGTFLDTYMKQVTIDDAPEEYHFFNGLIAIGLAIGRDVKLADYKPVYGNMFVCTLGRTGVGKSKATGYLFELLDRSLPFVAGSPGGARTISNPGSAEYMVSEFQNLIMDPSSPKKVIENAPVRGVVDYSELAGLIKRANRLGSTFVPTLMDLYDMKPYVETGSMTTGKKRAERPFASVVTSTQPRSLRTLLTKEDEASGFLNRWLFVSGREKQKFAIGGIQVDIEPAIKPLQAIQGWAGSFSGSMMEWSDEAAELFTEFAHTKVFPDQRNAGNELMVRLDLTLKKLILLFTANRKLKIVPKEVVEQVIVFYDYLVKSYGVPAGQIGSNVYNRMSEILENLIKRETVKNGGISRGKLNTAIRRYRAKEGWTDQQILATLRNLSELQMIEITKSPVGKVGKPTERFRYVG